MRRGCFPDEVSEERKLSDLLTRLIRMGNQLAATPSVYELCRQAVLGGLAQLNFERMSIWLVDRERRLLRGTFGTDEHGMLRDERHMVHRWSEHMHELELLDVPETMFRRKNAPLFDEENNVVGHGEVGAAALWNGVEVIGFLYTDNLISQQPISEERWRIFELFASTLGHLLSLKKTESALRGKEELLAQILDIMPVGVIVLSPDEVITHINRATLEIWEIEPESMATWQPEAVWVHNRQPLRRNEWAGLHALAQGESILNQVVEIIRKDGTRRVLLNSGVPLIDSSGTLTGAVVVNQDITESKRREQQLEAMVHLGQVLRPLVERRAVLTAVVNQLSHLLSAQGVVVVLADQEGRLIFEAAEGEYSPLIGVAIPEQLIGNYETLTELTVLEAAHDEFLCSLEQLKNSPCYVVVAPLVSERSSVGAVLFGFAERPDAESLSLARVLADVSAAAIQRGQLYDEVTTQASRLDRVMESVDFGLLLLDPHGRVVLANQHAQINLTHLGGVVVGEELYELGGRKLGQYLTPGNGHERMQEVNTDGVIFEITTVPVGVTGTHSGWLMIVHDVTRERSMQSSIQQHDRLAAVGQLASGIAHDFNNIVAVILLYVHMLQRNPLLKDDDRGRLNVIRDQAQNASKLIRQILDFSRQTVIERERVNLRSLIEQSVAFWERTLPESISFRLEIEVEGSAEILAEASSIQQVLTNLALNASDAMPNGGELRVLLREVMMYANVRPPVTGLKEGRWFEVCVMDNGDGIAPEHLPHIFDPFFTTKEIGKGTGLGLAQVYGIVQQHGGLVTAQSEQGKGTSFCLRLPAVSAVEPVVHEGDHQMMSGEGGETILLVEDNEPAREATAALLEMMGFRVLSAADGRAGLELFQRNSESIQLVLSDLIMPEMGGMELYRQVQSENPAISMLMMTGYPIEQDGELLKGGGVVEWLQKPFTVKQLTLAVRRMLKKASN